MESPQLRHLMRSASRSPHRKPRSRHTSECEPLQINVNKAVKYLGPPDITNCYLMFSSPRGHALIINNEHFDERTSDDGNNYRKGSDIDGNNLEELFKKLGFVVEVRRNMTRNEMALAVRDFSESDKHIRSDMAMVAVLSHGTEGFLYGTDRCALETEWIVEKLNNENSIHLRGKPKFFIFQACRGFSQDYGTPTRMSPYLTIENDVKEVSERTDTDAEMFTLPHSVEKRSPTFEDILIACSTIPGYVANRDTVRGSWFIECVCKVFMAYAATTDIRDMLDKVSMEMSTYTSESGTKQTCSYEVRHFYKKLFFNPGIHPLTNVANRRTNKHAGSITRPRSISDPYQLQFRPEDFKHLMEVNQRLNQSNEEKEPVETVLSRRPSSRRTRTHSTMELQQTGEF